MIMKMSNVFSFCLIIISFSAYTQLSATEYRQYQTSATIVQNAQVPSLPPSRNKDCEHGERLFYFAIMLIVIGILLLPVFIGIPILIIGKVLLVIAIIIYLWQKATC